MSISYKVFEQTNYKIKHQNAEPDLKRWPLIHLFGWTHTSIQKALSVNKVVLTCYNYILLVFTTEGK